jgi:hypothetical protein
MDILNLGVRKQIIDEINSDDNLRRKSEHQKRQHVFNDHQRPYVLKMLTNEFSAQTVAEMRTCTSINLSRRIITEMASIYKRCPERSFTNCTEEQEAGIEMIYAEAMADVKLKKANQKYKLHDQCAIQVLPHEGKIGLKLLAPHQFDVIPDPMNPEKAFAYVISAMNKRDLDTANEGKQDIQGNYHGSKNEVQSQSANKKIADQQDYQSVMDRYIIWTAELNLLCDGNGEVIEANPNPIGMLPFIDVASEKDFEFWVRRGSGVIDFALDFAVVTSDVVNTSRLQSYAQPIITAEKIPESITVGPQHILFLPIDPNRPEVIPKFEFANPNPDLKASLELQDRLVSYFLSAHGVDPKTINSSGSGNVYTSGIERLLASLERFEASQDDIDLFSHVEEELFEIMKAWYTVLQGTVALSPEYDFGVWPQDSELMIKFSGPEMVQTETDKEDSVIKLLEAGLISKKEAIMKLRGVDEAMAEQVLKEIEMNDQVNLIDQNVNQEA